MKAETAMEFYERIVSGTKSSKLITLELETGHALEDVELHPVPKTTLASVIERLPDEMFEAVEQAEGDAEVAEEDMEGDLSAVSEQTVEAFEDLCRESMAHEELAPEAMEDIVDELDFEVLFEVGTIIVDMSAEESGSIKAFHEQD